MAIRVKNVTKQMRMNKREAQKQAELAYARLA